MFDLTGASENLTSGTILAQQVAYDTTGNLFVAGTFEGTIDLDPGPGQSLLTSAGNEDAFLVKYDADERFVWCRRLGGFGDDRINALACGSAGTVYVGGRFESTASFGGLTQSRTLTSSGGCDAFVASFDTGGVLRWADRYGAGLFDDVNALGVQPDGNIVAVGTFGASVDFDRSASRAVVLNATGSTSVFVLNVDRAGSFRWVRPLAGAGRQYARDAAIAVDGSIAIVGSFQGSIDADPGPGVRTLTSAVGASSAFVIKLDALGGLAWGGNLSGPEQFGESVAVDDQGAVYVGGVAAGVTDFDLRSTTTVKSLAGSHVYLAKYDAAGNYRWCRGFPGGMPREGRPRSGSALAEPVFGSLVVDAAGAILSAGGFAGTVDFDDGPATTVMTAGGPEDVYLARWSAADGTLQGVSTAGGAGVDHATAVVADTFGRLALVGAYGPLASFSDFSPGTVLQPSGSIASFLAVFGNEEPSSIALTTQSVKASQPIGTLVGDFSTTDVNADDTFSYQLMPGSGDAGNASFTIVGSQLRTAITFPAGVPWSSSIRVRSTDAKGLFREQVFTVNVVDIVVDIALSSASILENRSAGTPVGTFSTINATTLPTAWNLVEEFSETSNPAGTWTYGWQSATSPVTDGFSAYDTFDIVNGRPHWGRWLASNSTPSVWFNAGQPVYGVARGEVSLHPGPANQPSIVRWTSPFTGTVSLVGRFGRGDSGVMDAYIRVNGSVIWAALDFGSDQSFTITRNVSAGDRIDWLVTGGYIAGNTPLDVTVSRLPTYTLVAGQGDADNNSFTIAGTELRSTKTFDYEARKNHSIRVQTTDGASIIERVFIIQVVDVDERPSDLFLSSASVPENRPAGTSVGTFSRIGTPFANRDYWDLGTAFTTMLNPDGAWAYGWQVARSPLTGTFSPHTSLFWNDGNPTWGSYRSSNGTPMVWMNLGPEKKGVPTNAISLHPGPRGEPAIVRWTSPIAGNVIVRGSFGAGDKGIVDGYIRIKDQPGRTVKNFSTDQPFVFTATVSVGTTIDWLVYGALSNADTPLAVTVARVSTYSLVPGEGDTDNGSFTIVGDELRTTAIFDHESSAARSIRVRASSEGGGFRDKVFTIGVSDVNEAPTDIVLSASSVDENVPAGTEVGRFGGDAGDPDAGDVHTYTLVPGDGSADNGVFQIVGRSLQTLVPFDYEARRTYSVRVRATDRDGLSVDRPLTISIVDKADAGDFTFGFTHVNQPGAEQYLVDSTGMRKYSEWQSPPKTYWGPRANDIESRLVYRFPFPTPSQRIRLVASSSTSDYFNEQGGFGRGASMLEVSKDGQTWVTLQNGLTPRQWGRDWAYDGFLPAVVLNATELWVRMRFVVESSANTISTAAQFGRSSTADPRQGNVFEVEADLAANVTPTDIVVSGSKVVEGSPSGTPVGRFTTTDADGGGIFTYQLVSGAGDADNASFTIVGDQLLTSAIIDYELRSSHSIRVRSTDPGGLFVEKIVLISVDDVDDSILTEPTLLRGARRPSAAVLTWTAPTRNGGTPIRDYLIQYSSDGGATWKTHVRPESAATTATVTGLVNGLTYVFRVAAVTSTAVGPYSNISGGIKPDIRPNVPTGLTATSRLGVVSLSWIAPRDNGGTAITDYRIQYSLDGTIWNTATDGVSTNLFAVVGGLARGSRYLFRIAAVNGVGPGLPASLALVVD